MNYETFVTVLSILGVFAAAALWVHGRTVSPDWQWLVKDLANDAVRAAEQYAAENEDKLDFAIDYVNAGLAKYGVKLPPVLVRGAVEWAVKYLKEEAAQAAAFRTVPFGPDKVAAMPLAA